MHEAKSAWVGARVDEFLLTQGQLSEKVGAISSRTRVGRAVQGAGSFLTPGDLSDVRSPVRSTIAETLTPGGGRGLRRPRARREREWRCPEGYQFGGRFTDSKWSTCGRQLFDLPSISPSLLQIARSLFRSPDSSMEAGKPSGRVLRGQEPSGTTLQSRAAQIPRVGPMSKKNRDNAIKEAISDLSTNSGVSAMMIRRDGFPMQPVVDFGELRKVPDNRNMEEAAVLLRPASISDLGADELGLLSNTGVTTLVYVTPNGSTIRMDRTRALSVGERRKLGKTVSSATQMDNSSDPLARLNSVVSESGGAISLRSDFSKIKNADEVISSGEGKGKPKWAIEAFKGGPKKGDASPDAPEAPDAPGVDAPEDAKDERISNIENAIEHINQGGNLSDIDPSVLMEAVKRSKQYKERKLGRGQTLYEREDGVSFVETVPSKSFEGLGAHFSSEMQQHLDTPAGRVRVAGSGDKRPYLTQTPDSVIANGTLKTDAKLSDMEAEDLVSLLVSDYLSDVRRRSPASLSGVETEDGVRAISSSNAPSGLIGLSRDEIKKRQEMSFSDFANTDGKLLANELKARADAVRQQIIEVYDDLIQRARSFKWDTYLERFSADGKLSSAEKRHLNIVQSVYEQRLKNLQNSREAFSELLGLTNE